MVLRWGNYAQVSMVAADSIEDRDEFGENPRKGGPFASNGLVTLL
jgi:hypothetical protein